jgi:CubicO group peptidase (beta-lactamase class C family)
MLILLALFMTAGCQKSPEWTQHTDLPRPIYPGELWSKAASPESLGWSSSKLAEARAYAATIDTAAVMIVDDGVVVDAWGDITRPFQCHSMRKSLMSGLIGIQVDRGSMDLARSIAELGIDDTDPALTFEEKCATVGDLIKARSGINHPALGESPLMKAMRPKRHSHPPGTFWHYNNWDFNALGTIFEQQTGTGIFEAFDHDFAIPLQMEDFEANNCRYLTSENYEAADISVHRYYLFRMSARDLARFGLLFLRGGRWQDRQIVSQAWVQESTSAHSRIGPRSWYGYMWWAGTREGLFPGVQVKGHCYHASGWGGHKLIVLPFRNLVVVHRVNTDRPFNEVSAWQVGRLLWHILDAAGVEDIGEKPTLASAAGVRLIGDALQQALLGCTLRTSEFTVKIPDTTRMEFWRSNKRIDVADWGVAGDGGWLNGKIITSGSKISLSFVREGNTLKWYDRDGTLAGTGIFIK